MAIPMKVISLALSEGQCEYSTGRNCPKEFVVERINGLSSDIEVIIVFLGRYFENGV